MRSNSRSFSVIIASGILFSSGLAAAQPSAGKAPLPLKTVRLYESGVGYFERSGKIGRDSGLALPVPVSHLDDALKTLVVLGIDGKTSVAGIEFASSISMEKGRALAGLPDGTGAVTHSALLRSLKGGAVELRTARESVRGKLVDVLDPNEAEPAPCVPVPPTNSGADKNATPGACVSRKETTLLVLTNDAEIRKFFLSDVVGVKPTDPALAARLAASASASSPEGANARRDLRVLAESTSDVTLGYVAEAPVWRSTYRMVLHDKDQRGTIQGWALVHNDTEEEWKKVKIQLVNGRPDSFLYPLAAPRYTRRELARPEEPLSTVPQLASRTADAMWSEEIGDSFGVGGLGISGVGYGGGGRGEGIGLGSVGTIAHGSGTGSGGSSGTSTVLSVGDLAKVAEAEGIESGALFRYALPTPVDLRPHGSALVPFLQQPIEARRIVWFGRAGDVGRSAARIKNDTKQTLPAGPISFFADGGFAGEAQIDRLKPGESRFIAFGTDIDVEITESGHLFSEEVQLAEVQGESLVEHFIRHRRVDYTIENRSGGARTVFLNLDLVRNASVQGTDELDFDRVTDRPLGVFASEPRSKKVRRLEADEGLSRRSALSSLDAPALRRIAASPKLPAEQKAALEEAARHIIDANARESLLPKRRSDLEELLADLGRLRGYLSAANGRAESEKFTARIIEKEARVKDLRTRIAALGTEVDGYRRRARATLEKLSK